MSENNAGIVEVNLPPPQERVVTEKAKGLEALPLRIYNLPGKVGGMEKSLEEINANEKYSLEAFLKKTRRLNNRCFWLSENAKLNKQVYEDRFGRDAIEEVQQKLGELPDEIKRSIKERTEATADKNIQKLRDMGYGR